MGVCGCVGVGGGGRWMHGWCIYVLVLCVLRYMVFIRQRAGGLQTLYVKVCGLCSCLAGDLAYHTNLVDLLTMCTEGKNVATEIKCTSLLPLDEIVRVVTDWDCIPEVCGWWWGRREGGRCEGEMTGRKGWLLLLRYEFECHNYVSKISVV